MPYSNCTELNQVHEFGVQAGHPDYRPSLDRDNDGVACEQQGKESQSAEAPAVRVQTEAGNSTSLPQTGPGEVTAIGALVIVFGAVVALAFRRRKVHFRA